VDARTRRRHPARSRSSNESAHDARRAAKERLWCASKTMQNRTSRPGISHPSSWVRSQHITPRVADDPRHLTREKRASKSHEASFDCDE
jgi:hypothetical protein